MIAKNGSGLEIALCLKDKVELERGGILECFILSKTRPKLVFHLVETVRERDPLEESGFHITATPPDVCPELIEQYDVYLSKSRFQKLISFKKENPNSLEGYFVSRSKYDRVDISYWNA